MVEVIHEHDSDSGSNGIVMLIGILVIVGIFIFFFYFFGRNIMGGFNAGTPQINIPDKVDVNVNQK
jgi:hypothetical protein